MQNRYTGDIGDFGKFGLLRSLQDAGLSIGVNWYLVPDEEKSNDGRFVHYLDDEEYKNCDDCLWSELRRIIKFGRREVSSLENGNVLKARFFSEPLDFSGKSKLERTTLRNEWHKQALSLLTMSDVVFLDPDNGLLVSSAEGTAKENKYVKPEELSDYFRQGASVIYYQHKARKPDSFYAAQHKAILDNMESNSVSGLGLKFTRTSQRYYFFIIQPGHRQAIESAVEKMLASPWKNHFRVVSVNDYH